MERDEPFISDATVRRWFRADIGLWVLAMLARSIMEAITAIRTEFIPRL